MDLIPSSTAHQTVDVSIIIIIIITLIIVMIIVMADYHHHRLPWHSASATLHGQSTLAPLSPGTGFQEKSQGEGPVPRPGYGERFVAFRFSRLFSSGSYC